MLLLIPLVMVLPLLIGRDHARPRYLSVLDAVIIGCTLLSVLALMLPPWLGSSLMAGNLWLERISIPAFLIALFVSGISLILAILDSIKRKRGIRPSLWSTPFLGLIILGSLISLISQISSN